MYYGLTFFLSRNIVLHKFFKFKPRRAKFLTIYQLYTNEICVREKNYRYLKDIYSKKTQSLTDPRWFRRKCAVITKVL